jgi:predicted transposase/invertase (TIGR01784 family)
MTISVENYINPFTDFGFKKLFGTEVNKDLLMDFLNELIRIDGKITEVNYLNSEQLGRSAEDRRAVYDIYCKTETGETFIVEMQKARLNFFKLNCSFRFFCYFFVFSMMRCLFPPRSRRLHTTVG